MDWFEKEAAFCDRFRNGTHCKNLWKRIPKKIWDVIDDTNVDSDGYWVYRKMRNKKCI